MLYEFIMTPDLFDTPVANTEGSAGVILIELLRRIAENGLSANLNKDRWVRHIKENRVASLPPALRDIVLACLSILDSRHRLVRHPKCIDVDPCNDSEWLNLAFDSHDRIPFHAIVLSKELKENCNRDCNAFVEFFSALDSAQWLDRRRRTLPLTKSEDGYCAALAPILRHAKALAPIDPWLNSQQSRFFKTVVICSNILGQRGHARLHGRIDIHAEEKKQKPEGRTIGDHLTAWEQKLRPLTLTDGHRFRVYLWESLPGSESMHDRFILTDQCAISAPGGRDCRSDSHANKTHWSLLDEEVGQSLWIDYDPTVSPFKLLGSAEIS